MATDHNNEPIQGIFDFQDGNANGYENWMREQEKKLSAIRAEWRLPLDKRVRVRLVNMDQEFEGYLKLAEIPAVLDHRHPLHLRIERMDFLSTHIEACVVLNSENQ